MRVSVEMDEFHTLIVVESNDEVKKNVHNVLKTKIFLINNVAMIFICGIIIEVF